MRTSRSGLLSKAVLNAVKQRCAEAAPRDRPRRYKMGSLACGCGSCRTSALLLAFGKIAPNISANMKNARFFCAAGALSVLTFALAGCSAIKEEHSNYMSRKQDIVNVVGGIWRIEAEWPGASSSKLLQEAMYEKAVGFCAREKKGMIPLTGSVENGSEDGSKPVKGWLEFRCGAGQKVQREYRGITLHLDDLLEDDDKKK